METLSRAKTVDELTIIFMSFFDEKSKKRGLAFKPRPTDVIVSPYAKCGTTWTQHIIHGLRSRGNIDFDEINSVVPWIEIAYDMGRDLDTEQFANPRLFKSHVSWHDVPKGARYIVPFRHYDDAIISFYRFFEGWFFEPDTINLEELISWRWPRDKAERQGYWYHLSSWWEQRHNENVLLLCYEDMVADLPGTVRRIAHFMGMESDEELFEIVIHQSSREFMLQHKDKFDERHIRDIGGERAGLPSPISSYKVTPGNSHDKNYQLSVELHQLLDDIWQEQITARLGLNSYEDLRAAIRNLYQ